jgi:tRNA A37 N6-isopentenylltransferase MiaA
MFEYPYERPVVMEIINGLGMKKKLLHIMTGPRQVGKTTAASQIEAKWNGPVISASGTGMGQLSLGSGRIRSKTSRKRKL